MSTHSRSHPSRPTDFMLGMMDGGGRALAAGLLRLGSFQLLAALLLGALLGAGTCLCPPAYGADDADAERRQLESWSQQLGADQYAVRTRATNALLAAGEKAVPVLSEAAQSEEREASYRAFHLLRKMASSGIEAEETASTAALRKLSESADGRISNRALRILNWRSDLVAERAVEQLRKLGADIRSSYSLSGPTMRVALSSKWSGGDEGVALLGRLKRLTWLSLEHSGVGDDVMPMLSGLDQLQYLYLGNTKITSRGISHLEGLNSLLYLSLEGLAIDDVGIEKLSQLSQLESLGLDGTQITDASAPHLAKLKKLRRLWLSRTKISHKSFLHLSALQRLERLYLEGSQVAGPGMAALSKMRALNYLSLKRVQLEADSLQFISKLQGLRTLGLDQTNTTDEMVKQLAKLPQLQIVWLSKTSVGDKGLMELVDLPRLRTIFVHGAKVTEAGEKAFLQERGKKKSTRCTVHR